MNRYGLSQKTVCPTGKGGEMNIFTCDGSYETDLKEYTINILTSSGVSSPNAERGIMYTADSGNTVARKLYADLIYYKKIYRPDPYREAFSLYLKASGITIADDGSWVCSGHSYPHAFRMLGLYLIDYKRTDPLRNCGRIGAIESMTRAQRLNTALLLSCACVEHTGSPEALNLIGRILREAAGDSALYSGLLPAVKDSLENHNFAKAGLQTGVMDTPEAWLKASEACLDKAVECGYVYACNNKAAYLADLIVTSVEEGSSIEVLEDTVNEYTGLLKASADKYEPYAANRLGLLYMTGEIHSSDGGCAISHSHINRALAREYFLKATKYPDSNSAWAFYNLIKYFHKDYDNNIELMNEHMDCIKQLNPRVYDLAIEL